jgi:hypothetical protein
MPDFSWGQPAGARPIEALLASAGQSHSQRKGQAGRGRARGARFKHDPEPALRAGRLKIIATCIPLVKPLHSVLHSIDRKLGRFERIWLNPASPAFSFATPLREETRNLLLNALTKSCGVTARYCAFGGSISIVLRTRRSTLLPFSRIAAPTSKMDTREFSVSYRSSSRTNRRL